MPYKVHRIEAKIINFFKKYIKSKFEILLLYLSPFSNTNVACFFHVYPILLVFIYIFVDVTNFITYHFCQRVKENLIFRKWYEFHEKIILGKESPTWANWWKIPW